MTLVLVRHASTDWSDAGRLNGWTDVPLNEHGRGQAKSLRVRLQGRAFVGAWSSDLTRAAETAARAYGDAASDARIRELDFGELEGKRWEQCSPEVQRTLAAFDGFHAPGGESVDALRARIRSFVRELADGDHLVFTHGGVIRCLLRDVARDATVGAASITELKIPQDHELLVSSNERR